MHLLLLLALTLFGSQAADLDKIIEGHLAAKGGAEKLRAVSSVKFTGRIKSPRGEMPLVTWAKRPNLIRRENTADGQTFVLGSDGKNVWVIDPMMSLGPREITGPQADMTKSSAEDFDSVLLDYKAKGTTVELVGKEAIQGINLYRLRVTKKGGAIQEIYLNAETLLESRIVMQLEQGGKKAVVTSEFSNYKPVDGITVPFSIRQTLNGQTMAEVVYDQVQFNIEIPDTLFSMPSAKK